MNDRLSALKKLAKVRTKMSDRWEQLNQLSYNLLGASWVINSQQQRQLRWVGLLLLGLGTLLGWNSYLFQQISGLKAQIAAVHEQLMLAKLQPVTVDMANEQSSPEVMANFAPEQNNNAGDNLNPLTVSTPRYSATPPSFESWQQQRQGWQQMIQTLLPYWNSGCLRELQMELAGGQLSGSVRSWSQLQSLYQQLASQLAQFQITESQWQDGYIWFRARWGVGSQLDAGGDSAE